MDVVTFCQPLFPPLDRVRVEAVADDRNVFGQEFDPVAQMAALVRGAEGGTRTGEYVDRALAFGQDKIQQPPHDAERFHGHMGLRRFARVGIDRARRFLALCRFKCS
jgi:hypothetical protein